MRYTVTLTVQYAEDSPLLHVGAVYYVEGPPAGDVDVILTLAWSRLSKYKVLPDDEEPRWATARLEAPDAEAHTYVYEDATPWEVHGPSLKGEADYIVQLATTEDQ